MDSIIITAPPTQVRVVFANIVNWEFQFMLEWFTLSVGTAIFSYISRASLRVPKSHGFYRFFAWELILLLFVLNLDGWYIVPLSFDQTISKVLMGISLIMVCISYGILRLFGQQDVHRSDAPLFVFEKTTVLVTRGIYRYIRHPMYCSLIFLDWGLFFKRMSWIHGSVALLASLFLVIAALMEERENVLYFGKQYQDYMKCTKRFVPLLM